MANKLKSLNELSSNSKKDFANEFLNKIDKIGFGSIQKSDLEAIIYASLKNAIHKNVDNIQSSLSSFEWQELLKVTPSKLRSIQTIDAIKFNDIDSKPDREWVEFSEIFSKLKIEFEDTNKGTVRFYLDDVKWQRFIEKFIVSEGSSLDYTLNKNQVVLKYEYLGKIISNIVEHNHKINDFKKELKKYDNELSEDANNLHLKNIIHDPLNFLTTIKENFNKDGFKSAAKIGLGYSLDIIKSIVANKLSA